MYKVEGARKQTEIASIFVKHIYVCMTFLRYIQGD